MVTLDTLLAKQDTMFAPGDFRLTFTSNHDENSWSGSEFERMGANHRPAYAVSALLARSIPLLYSGQEVSFVRRLQFFEKDSIDWSGPSLAGFYGTLFGLRREYEVLWSGPWGAPMVRMATDHRETVFAFSRSRGTQSVVVFANFGGKPTAVLMMPVDKTAPADKQVKFTSPVGTKVFDRVEILTDAIVKVKTEGGRYVVEAAIPLKNLNLVPKTGMVLRGDLGFISSDAAGLINTARTYWSNPATNLVNDLPLEAWMYPDTWSELTFE